ncbi:MAG: thermonuclease family protein [Arthrobacter sp.]
MIYQYNATINRWVDGDTVWLDVDLGFRTRVTTDFRLTGVDTPERGQPGHDEAVAYVNAQAPAGTAVTLTSYKDPDKYGRWLASILTAGSDVSINSRLVQEHLAVPYFGGKKP